MEIEDSLNTRGYAHLGPLVTVEEVESLQKSYSQERLFRSHIILRRHGSRCGISNNIQKRGPADDFYKYDYRNSRLVHSHKLRIISNRCDQFDVDAKLDSAIAFADVQDQ
jgi:hypothetical protein